MNVRVEYELKDTTSDEEAKRNYQYAQLLDAIEEGDAIKINKTIVAAGTDKPVSTVHAILERMEDEYDIEARIVLREKGGRE